MTAQLSDERRCHATNRQGHRCGRAAIPGGQVCHSHGGAAPNTRAAAARRLAEQRAARSLAEHGVDPLGDPLEAFRDLAAETVALKDFFAAKVAELEGALAHTDKAGREDVRAMLAAYERAMDRAGRILGDYARLGIADRLAQLDERRAAVVEAVIVAVLRQVGVDPAAESVRAVVFRELSAVAVSPRVIEVKR